MARSGVGSDRCLAQASTVIAIHRTSHSRAIGDSSCRVFVPPIDRLNSRGAGESISMIRANGKKNSNSKLPRALSSERISEASTSWKRDAELAEDQTFQRKEPVDFKSQRSDSRYQFLVLAQGSAKMRFHMAEVSRCVSPLGAVLLR